MTTETSQIETTTKTVDQVYRNDNHPKAVIQTADGERFSDYDGSKVPTDIRAEDVVDITFKTRGDFKNIVKVTKNANENVEVIENTSDYIENEVNSYAEIYKNLVEAGVPSELANTSASTIYIQSKRRRN
tara:strand:+ start:391 stop:780 length:390 start_codon:yes stop_codon:yes gene_type:complete